MKRQNKNKDTIRINKYIADTGFCSRREADQYITDERVSVNGVQARTGDRVSMTDKIRIDGEILRPPLTLPEEKPVEKKPKKKEFVARSQRESIDYSDRNTHKGTRGGVRNVIKKTGRVNKPVESDKTKSTEEKKKNEPSSKPFAKKKYKE